MGHQCFLLSRLAARRPVTVQHSKLSQGSGRAELANAEGPGSAVARTLERPLQSSVLRALQGLSSSQGDTPRCDLLAEPLANRLQPPLGLSTERPWWCRLLAKQQIHCTVIASIKRVCCAFGDRFGVVPTSSDRLPTPIRLGKSQGSHVFSPFRVVICCWSRWFSACGRLL